MRQKNQSRLKQYQLDKYLRTVDNGWINQKGQFYRGSVQVEDEEAWGIDFYTWLLAKDDVLEQRYFLVRQSLRDIPHSGDDNVSQLMRSQSKVISDSYLPFMDLRVKIHSLPEKADIQKVIDFKQKNSTKLTPALDKQLDALVTTMNRFFAPVDPVSMVEKAKLLQGTVLGTQIAGYANGVSKVTPVNRMVSQTAELLLEIREGILEEKRPKARL